jgi:hypothetical protein
MASDSRDRDRERLEHELESGEHQELLRTLQKKEPFLRQFNTWADVLAFMRSGTSRDPRKDDILRPVFRAHGGDQDPRWRAILLAIFWPGLESIEKVRVHETEIGNLAEQVRKKADAEANREEHGRLWLALRLFFYGTLVALLGLLLERVLSR